MNTRFIYILAFLTIFIVPAITALGQHKTITQRVDSLMLLMTLEEKIGQMNQYNDDWTATGPVTNDNDKAKQVKAGQVGSLLNCVGVERTRNWQAVAMQ